MIGKPWPGKRDALPFSISFTISFRVHTAAQQGRGMLSEKDIKNIYCMQLATEELVAGVLCLLLELNGFFFWLFRYNAGRLRWVSPWRRFEFFVKFHQRHMCASVQSSGGCITKNLVYVHLLPAFLESWFFIIHINAQPEFFRNGISHFLR